MIIITKITQPETGAVMLFYCPICKSTTITINQYAVRPCEADAWMLDNSCIENIQHNFIKFESIKFSNFLRKETLYERTHNPVPGLKKHG